MSEFEYQEDPNEDAWAAAYEEDPVQAQWAMAQAAQAAYAAGEQKQLDEQRVAVNAAAMLAQSQQQYASSQHQHQVALKAVASMNAQYGERFAKAEEPIRNRLIVGPVAAINWDDAQQVADFLEQQMLEAERNSPDNKYWNKVVQAANRPYWKGLPAHNAEHGSNVGQS